MTKVFSSDNENLHVVRIQRSEGKLSTELDGETVILDTQTGGYSSHDSIGTIIWNVLEQPVLVKNIIDKILSEYEVEQEECRQDVLDFLADLHDRGLVTVRIN